VDLGFSNIDHDDDLLDGLAFFLIVMSSW